MARDFVLEIGVEELPARFLSPALEQLRELTGKALQENRLTFENSIAIYGTPRRIAVYVTGVADKQESLVEEVKGPAVKVAFNAAGEPTRAALGFAKSQGVEVELLVRKPVGPVDYVFALKKEEGQEAIDVLPKIVPGLIEGLHFPKPMRWGSLDIRFARPIRWLLCLYGDKVVRFSFAGLQSDSYTYGHRFLSNGKLKVNQAADYLATLRNAFVLVDIQERRKTIRQQLKEVAAVEDGYPETNEELLEEVTNLVEFPTALCGSFDRRFLEMPEEVLITPMREHQRYFPVRDAEDKLLPRFVTVSNGGTGNIHIVRGGNEKVLRARLSDAAFFWQEDLKNSLEDRVEGLKKVVFQESLGTIYEKVQRISALAEYLSDSLGVKPDERAGVLRAAKLSKSDLLTNMVYEFPELQGVMGREYARRSNEAEGVAVAIYEHYLPRFAGDGLPATMPGQILSIADKIDTLVGCFGVGIMPTGSQDPYALRRQALGVCHVILDGNLVLSLNDVYKKAYQNYSDRVDMKLTMEQVAKDLSEFFRHRLRVLFTDRQLPYDTVDAVLEAGSDDVADAWARAGALEQFRSEPTFEALLTAFTRAYNLSRKAVSDGIDVALFESTAEDELFRRFQEISSAAAGKITARDYPAALALISGLQQPVDDFFEGVMVMVENDRVRENRLALLKRIANFIGSVADFSKLVIQNK